MNKIFLLLVTLVIFGCGRKETAKKNTTAIQLTAAEHQIEIGKTLFEGTGNCFACHKPDQKIIGPSLVEIAKIYKEKNGNMVAFLREKADPIVDPSQYSVMKTNFAITKRMSDEDLEAIKTYIYSHSTAK